MMIHLEVRSATADLAVVGVAGPAGEWAPAAPAPRVWVFVESADESCDVVWVGGWETVGRPAAGLAVAAPPWACPLWRG